MPQLKTHERYTSLRKADLGLNSCLSRGLTTVLSAGRSQSRLSILIYHRVLPQSDPLLPGRVDAQIFDRQMEFLTSGFNVIPLADAVEGLRRGRLPPRAASITFDDGYRDNAEVALPILQKHGIPATFFIATGFLDGGRMWNDTVIEVVRGAPGDVLDLAAIQLGTYEIRTFPLRRQVIIALLTKLKYLPLEVRREKVEQLCQLVRVPLPSDLMMTTAQIKKMHNAGMEIGGHTVNHPILARLEPSDARAEIGAGKETLENIVRAPLRLFAYPNGIPNKDYLSDHAAIVKSLGFGSAVSTAWGAAKAGDDLYQLPRFTPWGGNRLRFNLHMARNMLRKLEMA